MSASYPKEECFRRGMGLALRDNYIYNLPSDIYRQLCNSLDPDEGWRKLACSFGYSIQKIKQMRLEYQRANGSPTDKLLWDLGTRNVTVGELHSKLQQSECYRDMRLLESASRTHFSRNNVCKQDKDGETGVGVVKAIPPTSQAEDVNFFRPSQASKSFKQPPQEVAESKHYDDKIIPGKSSCQASNRGDASLPQENADESLRFPFGHMLISNQKEKELYRSLTKTGGQNSFGVALALITTPSITYKELSQVTNGFSQDKKLGEGEFGEVFEGTYLNTKCAIKKLFEKFETNDSAQGPHAHLASELTTLIKFRHENLVSLYAYAIDGEEVCLVYQYMPNGSLEDRIQCKNNGDPLTWEQRVSIMKGAACGLQYLHTLEKSPLIHGDMKSTNILLDKHMEAKIADLGLARYAEKGSSSTKLTHITKQEKKTKAYQCKAYLAPESQRGCKQSIKGDTFAFGVILFEICSGEKAYDEKREGDGLLLAEYVTQLTEGCPENSWKNLQDKKMPSSRDDVFISLLKLGLCCTKKKKDRPDMVQVYKQLEQLEDNLKDSSNQTSDGTSEEMSSKSSCMPSSTPTSSDAFTTSTDTNDANISYFSDGGQSPGNMGAPQQQQSFSMSKLCDQFLPGQHIPTPLVLQMTQDKSLPSDLIQVGDHWIKSGHENNNADQTYLQLDESDPNKLAEMEKFDREIKNITDKTTMKQKRDTFFSSYNLQIQTEEIYQEEKFDIMCNKDKEDPDETGDEVIQACNHGEVVIDEKHVGSEYLCGSPDVQALVNDGPKDKQWQTGKEPSECEEPSNDGVQDHCRGNGDVAFDERHVEYEGIFGAPDVQAIVNGGLRDSWKQSSKEPSECEELGNDRVEIDCNEEVKADSVLLISSQASDLPVADILENAQTLDIQLPDTEASLPCNDSIVNMSEMVGPPEYSEL
ncbi:hypothetical protein ScPMuIL_007470 [Solemya velum]